MLPKEALRMTVVNATKIAVGSTLPGTTDWKQGNNNIYVDVDTSAAGFTKRPVYITSISGKINHWKVLGASSVYEASATMFRIWLRWADSNQKFPTPEQANRDQWHINWIGIEEESEAKVESVVLLGQPSITTPEQPLDSCSALINLLKSCLPQVSDLISQATTNDLKLTGTNLTLTVNGKAETVDLTSALANTLKSNSPDITEGLSQATTNTLTLSGINLTSTVNGKASSFDLTPALNEATTHTITLSGTTLTSIVNDKNATVDLARAFPPDRDAQTITLTGNVLGISNGNTVDLSTIPAIAEVAEKQTLAFDPATGSLTLSVTNSTVNISPTARNGLSTNSQIIELGKNPLLHNTDIPSAGFNLTFSGNGNFGVGNNTPQQKLHITGASGEGIRISRKDNATVFHRFEFCDTDGTTTKTKIEQNYNDGNLYFNVAGKDPFRLCPNGIAAFNADGGIDIWGPSWGIDNSKSKLIRWGYNRPNSNGGDVITVYVPGNNDNAWEAMNIFSSTKRVGINTSNPDQTLSISGNASKTGGGSFAALSDARAKTDITPYNFGLELIEKLSPVKFRYKPEFDATGSEAGKQYVGFIAQELQTIAPNMVLQTEKAGFSDLLMSDLSELTFTLINAVKNLSSRVKSLEAKLAALSE